MIYERWSNSIFAKLVLISCLNCINAERVLKMKSFMQKFGLQRNSSSKHTALELEIAREQASALGRTGRKLRLSLEAYQGSLDQDLSAEQKNKLLTEIANNVWALLLQREFIGFVEGNLSWVRSNYVIPEQAIKMLGKQN